MLTRSLLLMSSTLLPLSLVGCLSARSEVLPDLTIVHQTYKPVELPLLVEDPQQPGVFVKQYVMCPAGTQVRVKVTR